MGMLRQLHQARMTERCHACEFSLICAVEELMAHTCSFCGKRWIARVALDPLCLGGLALEDVLPPLDCAGFEWMLSVGQPCASCRGRGHGITITNVPLGEPWPTYRDNTAVEWIPPYRSTGIVYPSQTIVYKPNVIFSSHTNLKGSGHYGF